MCLTRVLSSQSRKHGTSPCRTVTLFAKLGSMNGSMIGSDPQNSVLAKPPTALAGYLMIR